MKERPIIFKTEMVQAILSGAKTQTRRVVKSKWIDILTDKAYISEYREELASNFCPYGEVGTTLWVRETWRGIEQDFGSPRYEYKASEKINLIDKWKPSIFMPREAARIFLKVTGVRVERLQDISEQDAIAEGIEQNENDVWPPDYKLCPSCGGTKVHAALGQHLGVTEVDCTTCDTPIKRYKILWEKIYGKGSWDLNPFVWRINFEKL